MSSQFNYTVAPHLQHLAAPFPTLRAAQPNYAHYVGGGLIFSRDTKPKSQNNKTDKEETEGQLRILLLQRSFEDSYGGAWEGPGGSCDPEDESLLDGVAREVLEESGLHVSRFVELAEKREWAKVWPSRVDQVVKYTFIVEVHEARSALKEEKDEDGLPADKNERKWEETVKLDPAEHRDFAWATEDEVRESVDGTGRFKSYANMEKATLEGFRILRNLQ
ncbi:NUDIX hydrolase domain-like protein [Aspergillus unguis]